MNLEVLQLPLLPLVVAHSAHTLHKNLSERPRFAGEPADRRLRLVSRMLLILWFAINLAPVGYYVIECFRHWQDLFL